VKLRRLGTLFKYRPNYLAAIVFYKIAQSSPKLAIDFDYLLSLNSLILITNFFG
jgi:hypothetical protein